MIKDFFDFFNTFITSMFTFTLWLLKISMIIVLVALVFAIFMIILVKLTTSYSIKEETLILSTIGRTAEINIHNIIKIEDAKFINWSYRNNFVDWFNRIDIITKNKKVYTVSPKNPYEFSKNLQKINPDIFLDI